MKWRCAGEGDGATGWARQDFDAGAGSPPGIEDLASPPVCHLAIEGGIGHHDIAPHTRNAGYISKPAAIKWPRQWTGFLEIRRNLEDRVKEGAAYELRPQACRALAMLHALDKIDAFDADFWAQKTEDVKYWSSDETCNRGFVS